MKSSPKDFEVTVTVRNNRLKARRKRLGLTQKDMAAAIGISTYLYVQMETLRKSPFLANGDWRASVLKTADYFHVTPWEIFPDSIVDFIESNVSSTRTMELSASDLPKLREHLALEASLRALPAPDVAIEHAEVKELLTKRLKTLTKREEKVLRMLFGLDGKTYTIDDVAQSFGLSTRRIDQILHKALRKMRHPGRTRQIRDYSRESLEQGAHWLPPRTSRPPMGPYYDPYNGPPALQAGDWVWVVESSSQRLGFIVSNAEWQRTDYVFRVRLLGDDEGESEQMVEQDKMSPVGEALAARLRTKEGLL